MTSASLALLAIFSGVSVNLVFQLGLGISEIAGNKAPDRKLILVQPGLVFVTVLLLWIVFARIFAPASNGFFIYLLLFPASSLAYYALEYLAYRFLLKEQARGSHFCTGFSAAALFLCLNIAGTFAEALALSAGFVLGIMLSFLILGEIRRRSLLETVPKYLRGRALTLVSMGLLSLVFSAAAWMLYAILEIK